MDIDPIRTELRRKNREDRHGRSATCVMCGESALETLERASATLIEKHHPLGQNHEPDATVTLCRNCHWKLHELMAQEGADLRKQPAFLERLLQMLRADAAYSTMHGESLSRSARRLEEFIRQLDAREPEWRNIDRP